MEKRDLDFMCAFAEMHDMENKPFNEVYKEICSYISSFTGQYDDGSVDPEVVRDCFMASYESMKKYHLDEEIKKSMKAGMTFFEACADWDV